MKEWRISAGSSSCSTHFCRFKRLFKRRSFLKTLMAHAPNMDLHFLFYKCVCIFMTTLFMSMFYPQQYYHQPSLGQIPSRCRISHPEMEYQRYRVNGFTQLSNLVSLSYIHCQTTIHRCGVHNCDIFMSLFNLFVSRHNPH